MKSAILTIGAALIAALLAVPTAASASPSSKPGPAARTVPFFTGSFTDAGQHFDYTMVGRSPLTSTSETVVDVNIVPLRLRLSTGEVFDGGSIVGDLTSSPIFAPAHFDNGTTQYLDAMRRAEFWSVVANTGYHLRLAPHVLPTTTLRVPAGAGFASTTVFGAPTARINQAWLDAQSRQLVHELNLDPRGLSLFLTRDLLMQTARGCCVGGYHSVVTGAARGGGAQPIWTYAVADWYSPGGFLFSDVEVASHEIAEWADDPFGSNLVAPWVSPLPISRAVYGCYSFLETGDPTLDIAFSVDETHHLQDVAFLPWFARQVPSTAFEGRYTYTDAFPDPAERC